MANTADKVIKFALAEVGYIEKKSNKSLDSKTANKGSANYTKYNRDMKKVRGAGTVKDFWCANFVSWCFYKAFGKDTGKKVMLGYSNYVPTIYSNYSKAKRIVKSPKKGHIIIFGSNSHVGLIYKVTKGYVYTIEGNTSSGDFNANGGAVCKKKYSKNSKWIKCYCRPKYTVPVSDYPTLKKGSKGSYVKKLQTKLNEFGYNLKIDGIFGAATLAAVKKFQKKYKLVVDGIVGKKTWAKLYK
ncbi:peptidoglycan-binding protein [Anaerofustis stercorihominis]|uniref:peptidoglycan-binding protein n=1 Tax=Anaerofustis stercorihominis TaxID=214853 RepID=UPI001FA8804A|nr:peptidoglycan-binding protein [Anaerofustis stercorihominis]